MMTLVLSLLNACTVNTHKSNTYKKPSLIGSDLVCHNPERYAGRQIGDGHCVSLIRQCTNAPFTNQWRPGKKVLNATLPAGTVIATFEGQHYPSEHGYHAAIYIAQDSSGIWVWDQWRGTPVHQRLIKIRYDQADPGNTAQAYRVVQLKQAGTP